MKKIIIVICFVFAVIPATKLRAWDRGIHSGIVALAEANLTQTAKKNLRSYFNNESLVLWAQWTDDLEQCKGHEQLRNYHNVALTTKGAIMPIKKAAKSKNKFLKTALAMEGLEKSLKELSSYKTLDAEKVRELVCMVMTILADIHCPSHYIFDKMTEDDLRPEYYRDNNTKPENFLRLWEAGAFQANFSVWRAREYVHQLSRLTQEQINETVSGSLKSWIEKNARNYANLSSYVKNHPIMLKKQYRLKSSDYRLWLNTVNPVAVDAVQKAGYRIARVLNGIFDDTILEVSLN
ncbi:MAG: hypothetical protein KBS95_02340 [Alistipes sp.]|nr:hypothetical protein [Candidatus Alistipes equi]